MTLPGAPIEPSCWISSSTSAAVASKGIGPVVLPLNVRAKVPPVAPAGTLIRCVSFVPGVPFVFSVTAADTSEINSEPSAVRAGWSA